MKNYIKGILYGIFSWLIPFATAVFFYTSQGDLRIDIFLFKSIMIVVGTLAAAFLMVSYFKNIETSYLREGAILGLTWLAINLILDLVILVPMSGMPLDDYFTQIGIRYLAIPIISIAMGAALKKS